MKKYILILFVSAISFSLTSCLNDLDTLPIDPDEVVTFDAEAEFAKIYASLALTGNEGPAGKGDLTDIDEGMSGLTRLLWNLNELTSDEALCAWSDDKEVFPLNFQNISAENGIVTAMYYRLYFVITLSNHFLEETQNGYALERNEVRFIRALMYYYVVDLFGGGPFVNESSGIGAYFPQYINRKDLFKYVESELLAIVDGLKDPKTNLYGRADKAAAWMLLSRLYLNAEVYTGEAHYDDAAKYAKLVIDSKKYTLEPKYKNIYVADNHLSPEFIFTQNFDGRNTKTYSGTTFLVNSCLSDGVENVLKDFGVGGWGGNRARKALVEKFASNADKTEFYDDRAMFYIKGRKTDINKPEDFKEGYVITKFRNVTRDGNPGSDNAYPDTDFPMFRLGETYLNYAEAVCKAKTPTFGTKADAVKYVNELRTRANAAQISEADLNDVNSFFADERSRELYFEAQRRTDLIRLGMFNNTIWDWKGGIKEGRTTSSHLELYPIPANDIIANPSLKAHQNPGY